MAEVTYRTSTAWHYGYPTTWVTPTEYVYTGGTNPYIARQTFSGQTRIDNIGELTNLTIEVDTLNTSSNGGSMYVSSTALAPSAVATSGKLIGTWSTPNGTPFTMSLGSLNLSNLLAGIGSATTWYCYWVNNITAQRTLFLPTVHPRWNIYYNPGLMNACVAGVWRSGLPYACVAGVWRLGQAHATVAGTWRIGK